MSTLRLTKALRVVRSRRELARLNHVFIPAKKVDRDRFRGSFAGRFFRPVFSAYGSLSREGRAVFLLTIMIGFAGLDVLTSQVHLLFAMMAGVLVASLAARPFFRVRGMTIRVDGAARVSVGESQRLLLTLDNVGAARIASVRIVAPFLPWDGQWTLAAESIPSIAPGSCATTYAEARFLARGEHHLDAFEAGMLVPFGLAIGPRRESNGARFLVVPRIAPVTRMTLRHTAPDSREARVLSHVHGEAEFSGVRPYRAGDALKHLHARTWARTGTPHVKTYIAEKSERVGLALAIDDDVASDGTKEAALSLAAGIAAYLTRTGNGIGVLAIDRERFRIEPRTGRAALDAALDRLAVHELSKEVEPIEATIEEGAKNLSTLVLVTADESPRRRAMVDRLRATGLPVVWASVTSEPMPSAEDASGPRRVEQSAVEREEPITL